MSRTYRQRRFFQESTVSDSPTRIHDKDVLTSYDREVRLDRVTGEIKNGWRETEGNKRETRRARRRGGKIQINNGIREYIDEDEEAKEYLYFFFNGLL